MKERADTRQPLTCAEYRALRREMRITGLNTRLPIVEAQIATLLPQIQPIWEAMRKATSKHERELAYGRMPEGADWRYQQLTAERDNIVMMLVQEGKQ